MDQLQRRLQLHSILKAILGSNYVYFQPPPNIEMHFPCIVYSRERGKTDFADNIPYAHAKRYLITVIDSDPDSPIPDKVAQLPSCVFDRYYAAENLNHDVYNLFF